VARRHSGSAHRSPRPLPVTSQHGLELRPDGVGPVPATVVIHVDLERQIDCTWHVSGDRVDRLLITPETNRAAGIDEQVVVSVDAFFANIRGLQHEFRLGRTFKSRLGGDHGARLDGQAECHPGVEAAIKQHGIIMPHPAQQPPGAGGHCPCAVIVSHHERLCVDSQATECLAQGHRVRKRVASGFGAGRTGKVLVQIGIDGTRYVGLFILAPTRIGIHQAETAIHDAQRAIVNYCFQILRPNQEFFVIQAY